MAKSSQKAIFVQEVGKPLVLGQREIPAPPKGWIRIKVLSTMLLPHDTYGRDRGLFIGEKLPYILGGNLAGVVDALGDGVTSFQVGDEIFGEGDPTLPTPDAAGLQEYAIMAADGAANIPPGYTLDDLVTLPINATTSFEALFHPKGFDFPAPVQGLNQESKDFDLTSQHVVIIGGGSNVGKLGIQFARLAGLGTIITIASAYREQELKSMGATHLIDRRASDASIAEQIQAILPDGATHVYDCVNWAPFSLATSIVPSHRPSTILTLHPPKPDTAIDAGLRDCDLHFIQGGNFNLKPLVRPLWEMLPKWVEERKVVIPQYRVVEGFDVEKIEAALDDYRDGSPVLPVIVHPHGSL